MWGGRERPLPHSQITHPGRSCPWLRPSIPCVTQGLGGEQSQSLGMVNTSPIMLPVMNRRNPQPCSLSLYVLERVGSTRGKTSEHIPSSPKYAVLPQLTPGLLRPLSNKQASSGCPTTGMPEPKVWIPLAQTMLSPSQSWATVVAWGHCSACPGLLPSSPAPFLCLCPPCLPSRVCDSLSPGPVASLSEVSI